MKNMREQLKKMSDLDFVTTNDLVKELMNRETFLGIVILSTEIKEWPDDWPLYKQKCFGSYDKCCDMLVGPCCCGAWHQENEFELKIDGLYRDGKLVESRKR